MSSALGRYLEHFKCHWPESKGTKENIFLHATHNKCSCLLSNVNKVFRSLGSVEQQDLERNQISIWKETKSRLIWPNIAQ